MKERTFWSALCPVGLHRNMSIQVVQGTVCFFATVPSTFVHSFDLFVATTRALVLLRTWYRDKGIELSRTRCQLSGGKKDQMTDLARTVASRHGWGP